MPRLSRWFVRASLIYLGIGFTLGGLLLANKGLGFAPLMWRLLPSHMETLLSGWFVQLALGVAFWILPRFKEGPPRGDERLAWLAFALLNLGILAVVTSSFLPASGLELGGRLAQTGGAAAYALSIWKRVRPFA